MEMVCYQSNLYATQKNPNSTFTLDCCSYRKFTSATLFMSLYGLSCSRRFWAVGSRQAVVADCMSGNEFDQIKSKLHFVDNSSRAENCPGFKLMSLVKHFNKVCGQLPKEEMFSIDEQILPTKTKKSRLRQYNPRKPKKWGFKIFMITDPSGLVYKIEFYMGKQDSTQKYLGASGDVVMRLAEIIPKNENHKLFYDNWFSSMDLLCELQKNGIYVLSTFLPRRIPSIQFPTDSQMKRDGRESVVEKQCNMDGITVSAVKWFDNRGVHLLSNFVGSTPLAEISRYDRKSQENTMLPCPAAIQYYNKFMGGIDFR